MAKSKQKRVAQRIRSGLESKSSNKPERRTGKSGSSSQSTAHARKSIKENQVKYTPEAVDQLRLNFSSPDLCIQNLLTIGSAEPCGFFGVFEWTGVDLFVKGFVETLS